MATHAMRTRTIGAFWTGRGGSNRLSEQVPCAAYGNLNGFGLGA